MPPSPCSSYFPLYAVQILYGAEIAERARWHLIALSHMCFQLLVKVLEAVKSSLVVEAFLILPVAPLYLAVMSRRERAYELMPYAEMSQYLLKQRFTIAF